MNLFKTVFLSILILTHSSFAGNVVFLGLSGPEAPSIEESFETLLREQWSTSSDYKLADYIECQRYKEKIRFEEYPTVSVELLKKLAPYTPDSSLLVWGKIKELKLWPERRLLCFSRIKAEITISYTLYNLANSTVAYSGEVKASSWKNKGLILFNPVQRAVHISAIDRAELTEKLQADAARASGKLIALVIRSTKFPETKSEPDTKIETYKVPSSTDIFTEPKVEKADSSKNR